MSWFFGKTKSNLPEPTALQSQRTKQIEQLKSFNQNVTEIHRDVEYRVHFVVNHTSFFFHITLPPQFPNEKPSVKVSPAVRHPWVNDQMMVVGSPGLNNFVVHSDLGKVIRQVVDEFQRNPPSVLPTPAYGNIPYPIHPPAGPPAAPVPAYTPYAAPAPTSFMPPVSMPTLPPVNTSATSVPSYQAPMMTPAAQPITTIASESRQTEYQLPEIPTTFTQLAELSNQELQELADDEDRLLQIISQLPEMKKISDDRDAICLKNEEQARENLAKKPLIEDQKKGLLENYDLLNDVRRKFEDTSSKQEMLRAQFDPSQLQARLKVAASEAEEESENIAEQFLSGAITVEEFNKRYMHARKLSHMRRAKEEKLSQYILQGGGGF